MSFQPEFMGNGHSAQHQGPSRYKSMHIIADSRSGHNPLPSFRRDSFRQHQVFRRSHFEIIVGATDQPDTTASPLDQSGVIRSQHPRLGGLFVRLPQQFPAKGLGRLNLPQGAAVQCLRYHQLRIHCFNGVFHRHGDNGGAEFFRSRHRFPDRLRIDERTGAVMNQYNINRRIHQSNRIQYRILPFRATRHNLPGNLADRIVYQNRNSFLICWRDGHQNLSDLRHGAELPQRMPQ